MFLNYIDWSPNIEIFHLGSISVRWYGLLFFLGFIIGAQLMKRMFSYESIDKKWVDSLFIYVIIATIFGARLGHVFFYDWDYFQNHLVEILLPVREQEGASIIFGLIKGWKFTGYSGLASHGGAIGIIIALGLFSLFVSKKNILWILDRMVLPTALAAVFIRLGNLMNSEIIGVPTDLPWGFRFLHANVADPMIPRHPTQIYEAFCYLITFVVLMFLYWRTRAKDKPGYLLGVFFVMLFTARFFIEFIKENQKTFEDDMALNMGQWLSIPFIIIGLIFIIFRHIKNNNKTIKSNSSTKGIINYKT